eukprot:g19728.t1
MLHSGVAMKRPSFSFHSSRCLQEESSNAKSIPNLTAENAEVFVGNDKQFEEKIKMITEEQKYPEGESRFGPYKLRWRVSRTPSGKLPVYTEYRHKKTQICTIIRRIEGDVDCFIDDLKSLVGPQVPIKKRQGKIQIPGHKVGLLRVWLSKLGF